MSALLFPGQGSQVPGMGRDFYEACPAARRVMDMTADIYDITFLFALFEGPEELLRDTCMAQPALVAVGAAIAAHLQSKGFRPTACAGHSIGEISALVAAGALTIENALILTQHRARLMAGASGGTMAAVLGLAPEAIAEAMPAGVEIANFNGPQQTIISGTHEGIAAAQKSLKKAGAKRVMPLNVSGPFHSSLMRSAAEQFGEIVAEAPISKPKTRFISSVSGQEESDPDRIKELLARQIDSPVQWTKVMQTLGPVPALEAGPGNVLAGLAKRMDGAPIVSPAGTLEHARAALSREKSA